MIIIKLLFLIFAVTESSLLNHEEHEGHEEGTGGAVLKSLFPRLCDMPFVR
jgi:hypothetical protein